MICLQKRHTCPSVVGALQSSMACPSNITPIISFGSSSCITSDGVGFIFDFVLNQLLVNHVGSKDFSKNHIATAGRAWLALAQSPSKTIRLGTCAFDHS